MASGYAEAHDDPDYGACQLVAPVVLPIEVANADRRVATCTAAFFPVTHSSRQCGEWESADAEPDDGAREDVPNTVVRFQPKPVAA